MSKTLEELQAELDAEQAAAKPVAKPSAAPAAGKPPPPGPTPARSEPPPSDGPRRRRGLFDFLLTCALLYGVYAMTPLGAMGEAAVRVALGQKNTPSFFATFRGRETNVVVIAPDIKTGLLASKKVPAAVATAAKTFGVDAELLVTLLTANGACDSAGCTVKTPKFLARIVDGDFGETVTIAQAAQGISKAASQLQIGARGVGGELGVESLYVGVLPVRLALEQAKATGIGNAEDVEAHAQFFSPSVRRGVLQNALAVLALHRLRTLAWPAKGKWRISSPFGYRTHPVLGTKKFHNGTDLAVPKGTPLLSPSRGVVKRSRRDSICGNYIKITHGFGIETTFCHMSQLDVAAAQRVTRKQEIGKSGATGRVTGAHLHYILRVNGDPVDAEMYGASPSRKKPAEGEDPLGKIEAVAAAEMPTDPDTKKPDAKKPRAKKPRAKKPGAKRPDAKKPDAKKPDAKKPDAKKPGAKKPGDEKPATDAGVPAEQEPESEPAMPVPDGEASVDLESVHAVTPTPTSGTADAKVDAKTPDAKTPDAKTPDAKTPDAKTPDAKTPDAKTPDAKAPKAKTPDAKAPKAKTPDAKAPDAKAATKKPGAPPP